MNTAKLVDWFTMFFVVALVYLLVRPGSHSVDFVKAFSEAMVGITTVAADFV